MPSRPPIHKPPGWAPPKRVRVDDADRYYGTQGWRRLSERCKRRDGYRCTDPECTTPGRGYGGRLIADHVIPRREGGADELSNLMTRCNPCHERVTRRGAKG